MKELEKDELGLYIHASNYEKCLENIILIRINSDTVIG